jgi:hypothetical protein
MMMDRRDFLKGTVGLSVAGVAAWLMQPGLEHGVLAAEPPSDFAVQGRALGRLFQGTRDGQVFESVDDGKSWNRIVRFGQQCEIVAIRDVQGKVHTEIRVQGHRFAVNSTDARLWRLV